MTGDEGGGRHADCANGAEEQGSELVAQRLRAALPPAGTERWVASRKAAVVRAVAGCAIARGAVCERYGLTEEELQSWMTAFASHGDRALRTTAIQNYRQPKVAAPRVRR